MKQWRRPSVLCIAAALSAVLLAVILLGWARSYPHAGCLGWDRLQESTRHSFVTDSYTLQGSRGLIWFGRCRIAVLAPLGFKDGAARLESTMRNIDVFGLDGLPSPVKGTGWVSGTVTEALRSGGLLSFQLDGLVLPSWLLALGAAILPAWWIVRRLRSGKRAITENTSP